MNLRAHNVIDLFQQQCPEGVRAVENEPALLQFFGESSPSRHSRIRHGSRRYKHEVRNTYLGSAAKNTNGASAGFSLRPYRPSAFDREQPPGSRNTLQLVFASVDEADS